MSITRDLGNCRSDGWLASEQIGVFASRQDVDGEELNCLMLKWEFVGGVVRIIDGVNGWMGGVDRMQGDPKRKWMKVALLSSLACVPHYSPKKPTPLWSGR
jgi:hypothetical protein